MKKLALFALVTIAACAQPQRPVEFTVAARAEDPFDTMVRALAANGLTPANVDRQAGVIQTQWQDTGFLYGQIAGVNATIVRRYAITLSRGAQGTNLLLRADTQRCAQGTFNVVAPGSGACEGMEGLVPPHQEALDALGARLRQAAGG